MIATAAAAAVAPPTAAEPSAFDVAAGVSEAFSVSAPPTAIVIVDGSVAFALALAIVTATAAATETVPVDVDADGVAVDPDPEPPFDEAAVFAFERSPATCPSTPPAGAPGAPSPGAPVAEAVEDPCTVDEPVAWNVAAPATFSERPLVTVAM